MITRIVKLTIQPSNLVKFITLYTEAQKQIRLFEGCLELSLMQDVTHSNIIFTISKWQSESNLNNYRNSDFFKGVWKSVKPMFAAKAEAWSLNEVG